MEALSTTISEEQHANGLASPRVVLHIGMSKAGSSAIQQALVDHDEMLRSSGILYPRAGRRGVAHYKINEDLRRQKSTARLRMALDEAAGFRTAVLSCEGFWLFSDDDVVRLREGFGDREVEVILYLRRPASYLPSSYRQGMVSNSVGGRNLCCLIWPECNAKVG